MFILTVIMYSDCLPMEQALSVPVNSVHVAQQKKKPRSELYHDFKFRALRMKSLLWLGKRGKLWAAMEPWGGPSAEKNINTLISFQFL